MKFEDQFTTEDLKIKDAVKEKDKMVISNDAYSSGIQIDKIIKRISLNK
jgi:hypothetical protein